MRNSLERIEQVNPTLNCFCFVYPDEALERAGEADRAAAAGGELGPLHGVPIAIKDLTPTAGKTTTMGSYAFEHFVPDRNALIVDRLLGAGAIMVGKTTTPEFAYSSFTESPLWGITRNPWNPERTPGGSSGGAGAAVASGCVPLAEGSDMGGSIRIPAAWSGTVGLKPSFGRVPLDFLPTQFDTIQHVGPLARTIADARLFLACAQGPDERDIMSLAPALDLSGPLDDSAEGLRLALDVDLGHYAIDPEVEAATREAAAALAEAGAEVEEVDLRWTRELADAWVEHWGVYLAAIFGHTLPEFRDKMDPRVVRLMEAGLAMSAVDFKRLEFVRTRAWQELAPILERHDAFLCPTMSGPGAAGGQGRLRVLQGPGRRPLPRARHHESVQLREPVPGALGPVGLERRRPADRAADRRPPLPGRPGAANRGRPGAGVVPGRTAARPSDAGGASEAGPRGPFALRLETIKLKVCKTP